MYIEPPRIQLSKYVDGSGPRPPMGNMKDSDARAFVKAYREVCARDNRRCTEDCVNYGTNSPLYDDEKLLYSPHLKLWVENADKALYDANNLRCVCYACARKLQAKHDRLSAADVTGLVREAVLKREGRVCRYCHAGPIREERARVVPAVSKPDEEEPGDWLCCCKTCEKNRGQMSHEQYIAQRVEEVSDLFGALREEAEELDVIRGV